jgi:crotonobetainyl-CoA:carnitine CoA-transferase CaiB-like acyl-CoA transferase
VSGPLDGVTVLAAEQMHSLPHATQLLALLGADVIKVEPPGGEAGRSGRPTLVDRDDHIVGSTFIRNNLAKSSIVIDLKSARGLELFLRLAATVDVVAENFRPGTAEKLGIAYDDVRRVNARAVYVSISGFGNADAPPSPYREWAAYAPIVEGMAGLYEYSREPSVPPRPALAGALGDTAPGLYAVIGVLAALHERERTGAGRYVDISMYDAMIAVADVVHPASMGVEPSHAVDGIGILHAFRAQDGFFTVEVVREGHFPRFATAVGHLEWLDDARLLTRSGWSAHIDDVIRPGVEAWAATRSKRDAATELARHGVAAGPVNTAADIRADPHVRARAFVHEFSPLGAEDPDVAVVGSPIAFHPNPPGGAPEDVGSPGRWPLVGEHTDRVLRARLAIDDTELAELRATGVIA